MQTSPSGDWQRVVYGLDCDEYGNCPNCGIDFAECPCIGPTEDDVEYQERADGLYGRRTGVVDGEEELAASARRLTDAGLSVAVWRSGEMRMVDQAQVVVAWLEGATVFSPQEMFDYIRLPERERKLVRELKGLR